MDFAAVATSVLAVIVPYVSSGAEGFAQQAGKVAFGKAGDLLEAVAKRWKGDQEAEQTLELFRRNPDRYASVVSDLFLINLEADPVFAAEVRKRLDSLGPHIEVIQTIKVAERVTGARVKGMKAGKIKVDQTVDEATDLTGVDIDKLG